MRKFLLAGVILATALGIPARAQATTYSVSLGANFFEYSAVALETSVSIVVPLNDDLSIEGKAAYAVQPVPDDPFMAIPVQAGVRFSFGYDPLTFLCSIGIEPIFVLSPAAFRLGPYFGVEASLRVHPFLEVFAGAEQNLLFGGPNYVSTGSRMQAGFRFSLK
ncbi:MAG: hypothetical protein E4H20_01990 [Spirochaetales bacterium]|nr:MAG: hypothetical protein E4H20_01990 [Spirochaetales bacterium]